MWLESKAAAAPWAHCHIPSLLPVPATLSSLSVSFTFSLPPHHSFSSTVCPLLTFLPSSSVPFSCVFSSVYPWAISHSLNLIQITAIQLSNALLACQANVISQNQKELICKFRCRGNKKIQVHKWSQWMLFIQVKFICISLFTIHTVLSTVTCIVFHFDRTIYGSMNGDMLMFHEYVKIQKKKILLDNSHILLQFRL